jgi:hypothetical protein
MSNINKIYNVEYKEKFKNYIDFFSDLDEEYDEKEIFPRHTYEEFIKNKNEIQEYIKKIDTHNYKKTLERYSHLFSAIKNSKINLIAYKALCSVEKNLTILSTLKGFKPLNGYAEKCNYNNASNISGRIIVEKGPNILTLPKRCRTIFESRFKEGNLISLDFSNLEPRLCLKITKCNEPDDIYNDIIDLLEFEIDRSVIKRSVISVLYGAGYESLRNISSSKAKIIFETIKEYFKIDEILEISKNIDSLGIRRNYFGRPIWNLEEKRENILINNYIQSSAVDVSLTYFSDLVKRLNLDKAVPVFIIHDAIVFDVESSYLNEFNDIINNKYEFKDLGFFPITTEKFNVL